MSRALMVVDMLVGFMEKGHPLYCGDNARSIIPVVVEKAQEFTDRGDPVIFIADHHAPDDLEFKQFPPHCIEGTREAEVIDELQPFVKPEYLVPKTRYGAFYNTRLETMLSEIAPESVEIVGVCTNICVLYTVEELRNRDYMTIVHRDGVASFDGDAHAFALGQIESVLGAEVR
jgi:nicotinamidase/pyrazinamidase